MIVKLAGSVYSVDNERANNNLRKVVVSWKKKRLSSFP